MNAFENLEFMKDLEKIHHQVEGTILKIGSQNDELISKTRLVDSKLADLDDQFGKKLQEWHTNYEAVLAQHRSDNSACIDELTSQAAEELEQILETWEQFRKEIENEKDNVIKNLQSDIELEWASRVEKLTETIKTDLDQVRASRESLIRSLKDKNESDFNGFLNEQRAELDEKKDKLADVFEEQHKSLQEKLSGIESELLERNNAISDQLQKHHNELTAANDDFIKKEKEKINNSMDEMESWLSDLIVTADKCQKEIEETTGKLQENHDNQLSEFQAKYENLWQDLYDEQHDKLKQFKQMVVSVVTNKVSESARKKLNSEIRSHKEIFNQYDEKHTVADNKLKSVDKSLTKINKISAYLNGLLLHQKKDFAKLEKKASRMEVWLIIFVFLTFFLSTLYAFQNIDINHIFAV